MAVYPSSESIIAIRDNAVAALADSLDPTKVKPSYSIDGQTVSWSQYRESLQKTIEWATEQLKNIDAAESGPGYEETIGI